MVLEDLAAHFKMKAQDTIDRVTELLDQGHITGVMDDRGKFIYISQVCNFPQVIRNKSLIHS